ncbi:MAG: hypothetical protein SNJ82_03225 [Gemmataceae bacterium]
MLLALCLIFASPVEDLHASIGQLASQEAVRLLDKPLDLKLADFRGTLTAVEPAKRLTVEVRDLALAKDRVRLLLTLQGEFDLAGQLDVGEKPFDLKARLRLKATSHGRATLTLEKRDFIIRPAVQKFELTEIEVVSFEPNLLLGGKALIANVIRGLVNGRRAELDKLLAEKLQPLTLPRPAVISGPAPAGDNPVLRRYAQSVILSRLVEHDSPKTGLALSERDPAFSVSGNAWLHRPTTQAKVEVDRLVLRDGVLLAGGQVEVPAVGQATFDIPGTVRVESDFQLTLVAQLEGDLQFQGAALAGGNVYTLAASIRDLRIGAVPVRLLSRAVERVFNRVLAVAATEYRGQIESYAGGAKRERLVAAAYRLALLREPDAAGHKGFQELLETQPPREILARLLASPEFEEKFVKGKKKAEVIAAVYRAGLARDAGVAEIAHWEKWLAQPETLYEERRVRKGLLRFEVERVAVGTRQRTYRDLITVVLQSDEYRQHFGNGLPYQR